MLEFRRDIAFFILAGIMSVVSSSTDNKVHGTNMGPIWGRQDPGGPHVGPMNFAIWGHHLPTKRF